ncbi:MAG: DNA alkylation repair protein [bacterium]|nr:DNA alkylation repair protein [bacterium]
MSTFANLRKELKAKANQKRAKGSQRFFKTGPGEYGEGDIFLGISSSAMRPIAKKFNNLRFKEISELLKSKIHEERQIALFILIHQFRGAMIQHSASVRHKIFNFYLKNTKYINNWDLVDLSAPKIVGDYLLDKNRKILYKLAESRNLWERRIAILATYAFIKKNQFIEILKISEMLLNDKHDLIHKAVGWMLREVGKRSQTALEKFLKKYASKMPRVMLRYAIERLPEGKRKGYLGG